MPMPKISFIDSAWLITRPSNRFLSRHDGSFGVKIGDLGKNIP